MRIAFIDVTTTVSYGGIQTAVWQLACALTDLGHEVHVLGGEGNVQPDLRGRHVHIHRFPFTARENVVDLGSRFQRIWERASFARYACRLVRSAAFDWVVLTKPFDFFWGILLRNTATRVAFMSGGTDFYWGDRCLSRGVVRWLACSHFNAWQIQHRYKRFPTVIYNGVDTGVFTPQRETDIAEIRARLGVATDTVLFGFAGRIVGWKGLSIAVQALADSALAQQNVRLLLIGDGPERAKLRALIRRLALDDKVILHDAIAHHQLPVYYGACDVGIFPSVGDEAFGITIAEAMSCGLPVLASHIGGIPEVVGNEGTCGVLTTPGDVAQLALAMRELAMSAEKRRQMGLHARQRIIDNYTWQHAAQRLLAALG